jgi:hypothetical protein
MIRLKKVLRIIPFLTLSCASNQYLKSYEPINVFLEKQKIDKNKKYILQSDKVDNKQTLRIFNGGEGADHVIDPTDPIDYTHGLFVEKYWKKIYNEYAQDNLKRHWKKDDYPQYNFILEKGTGLTLKESFLKKYMNSGINEMIIISEPMYYMNKKYIMFYYCKVYFDGSGTPEVVIMKKVKKKWTVVREIGDYIYN